MKSAFVVIIAAFLGTSAAQAQPEVVYDKFKQTTTMTSDWTIIRGEGPQFRISASVTCPGDALCRPKEIKLIFTCYGNSWQFDRSHKLIMLVDGARCDYGDVLYDRKLRSERPLCIELMVLRMPLKDFASFISAKLVEFQLGPGEYSLDEDDREDLREFYAKLP